MRPARVIKNFNCLFGKNRAQIKGKKMTFFFLCRELRFCVGHQQEETKRKRRAELSASAFSQSYRGEYNSEARAHLNALCIKRINLINIKGIQDAAKAAGKKVLWRCAVWPLARDYTSMREGTREARVCVCVQFEEVTRSCEQRGKRGWRASTRAASVRAREERIGPSSSVRCSVLEENALLSRGPADTPLASVYIYIKPPLSNLIPTQLYTYIYIVRTLRPTARYNRENRHKQVRIPLLGNGQNLQALARELSRRFPFQMRGTSRAHKLFFSIYLFCSIALSAETAALS